MALIDDNAKQINLPLSLRTGERNRIQRVITDPMVYDVDKALRELRIAVGPQSYSTFDDLVTRFNISRLPDYANMTQAFAGHLIFTRPSLYLDVNSPGGSPYSSSMPNIPPNASCNFHELLRNPKTSAMVSDPIGRQLTGMLSEPDGGNAQYYMPLFTTRAMSYSTADVSIKTVDKAQTFYGHTIKYGQYSEDHKIGGTMSIDFRNDRYWSILKAAYIWMSYIYLVSHTEVIKPSLVAQENAILDYCGSIYYLVTLMDMRTLVYWEKLTGVFPRTAPFSLFSYTDSPQVEDKITIEFDYGMRSDPCDTQVLIDLNYITGYNENFNVHPGVELTDQYIYQRFDSWRGNYGGGDAYAYGPFISTATSPDENGMVYYLNWLKQRRRG